MGLSFLFRTDASNSIGSGHVSRSLTIARALRERGHEVQFACREIPGNLIEWIESAKFKVFRLPVGESEIERNVGSSAEWFKSYNWRADSEATKAVFAHDYIWLDHYGLDYRWQEALGPESIHLVVDDLANRRFSCCLLVNQNSSMPAPGDYTDLVSRQCKVFLGPSYNLFLGDDKFLRTRKSVKIRNQVERVLCFFGGADPSHLTLQFVKFLASNEINFKITVVCGAMNSDAQAIKELCNLNSQIEFSGPVPDMALLMAKHDLAVGSSGVNAWERAFLALPSLVVQISDNQMEITRGIVDKGAGIYCGSSSSVSWEEVLQHIARLQKNRDELTMLSSNSYSIWPVDVSERVHPLISVLEKS